MIKENNVTMENKRVLVVGMGNSGKAAVQAMVKLGARVSVTDSKNEDEIDSQLIAFLKDKVAGCYFGQPPQNMSEFDIVILSPGVSPELDFIQEARAAGAEIIGELEIAYRVGQGNYVAITGTNGKTTTTTLVGEIFKNAGKKTYVVGNIGVAVISKALMAEEDSWLITETSSFQLETIDRFKPVVSAILNLTPDHMDRHKTMENYGKAKAEIFRNQTEDDYCIVNYDDEECMKLCEGCRAKIIPFSRITEPEVGAFVKDEELVIKDEGGNLNRVCGVKELIIPGSHNLENALAACAICFFGGIDVTTIAQTLREFKGVEHRIELCGEVDGIRFVNDSKGTNTDAAAKAIEAMKENIILIAGGYDKGASFDEFVKLFNGRVKQVLLLGKTAPIIKEAAEKAGYTSVTILKDMEACVREAYKMADSGDVVLLSPACASWDMYSNFEQRGNHFKSCVEALER